MSGLGGDKRRKESREHRHSSARKKIVIGVPENKVEEDNAAIAQLRDVRHALLGLNKALLDGEHAAFERAVNR
jgi:hypothetical protein